MDSNGVCRERMCSVCLLHTYELPHRHLEKHLDCGSSELRPLAGPTGQKFHDYEKLPVVSFDAIEIYWINDLEEIDLTTDQEYLLDICRAVSNGNVF